MSGRVEMRRRSHCICAPWRSVSSTGEQNIMLQQTPSITWHVFIHSRYAEAEPMLRRALAIREQYWGAEHPNTAASLDNLADLRMEQGRYAEAEPLYQRALAIRERRLGPEHTYAAISLNDLAHLYQRQGRYA